METKAILTVLSKDKQKEVAVDIFNRYPKANKVAVASDGQAFITDCGDASAKNHAMNNRYGKELKLETFTRDEFEVKTEVETATSKTAKEVIALIEAAKTADEVKAIVDGDTRATVVAAAAKKLETLNTSK